MHKNKFQTPKPIFFLHLLDKENFITELSKIDISMASMNSQTCSLN